MRVRQLIGAVTMVAGLVTMGMAGTAQATGTPPPNTNEVTYWCGSSDLGVKYDNLTSSTFTVPSPPTGKVWTLLVLKAGSDVSTEGENEVFPNPIVGQAYMHSSNKTLSHAILCFGETTTTTLGTTTTSTTLGTTTTTSPTTTLPTTTTTAGSTTTLATTTTLPGGQPSLFAVGTFAFCGEDNLPLISITFGIRPDLDGQTGTLIFSDFTITSLTFDSGATVTIPYPASRATPLLLIYILNGEVATAVVTLPENCPPVTTTTTTTVPPTTTTLATTTTAPTTTLATTTTVTTTVTSTPTTLGTTVPTVPTTPVTICVPCERATTVPTTPTTLATTLGTTGSTTPPTTVATTLAPVTTVVRAAVPPEQAPPTTLPVTGGDPSLAILVGLGMTAGGGVLVFTGRKRAAT